MIELVLLGAAAISIAVTASVHSKRRFAPGSGPDAEGVNP